MSSSPIHFQFEEERSARQAVETLQELGYEARLEQSNGAPLLHLIVDHSDLTSALEISQANGGTLVEKVDSPSESDTYGIAYSLQDTITIPAHVVNEDWAPAYAESPIDGTATSSAAETGTEEDNRFDPSGDDYDSFTAGIHI